MDPNAPGSDDSLGPTGPTQKELLDRCNRTKHLL